MPPLYYWMRFAQKSTNAGAAGLLGRNGPLGLLDSDRRPIGPRGPALRGWDSTGLFEQRLHEARVTVRTGSGVTSIVRGDRHVPNPNPNPNPNLWRDIDRAWGQARA